MKFQRQLSEPHIVFPQQQRSGWSLTGKWRRFIRRLSQSGCWESWLKLMTGSSEPIVEQRCDLKGKTSYMVYDPVTQQKSPWLSETEARAWLEQRYYQ